MRLRALQVLEIKALGPHNGESVPGFKIGNELHKHLHLRHLAYG